MNREVHSRHAIKYGHSPHPLCSLQVFYLSIQLPGFITLPRPHPLCLPLLYSVIHSVLLDTVPMITLAKIEIILVFFSFYNGASLTVPHLA